MRRNKLLVYNLNVAKCDADGDGRLTAARTAGTAAASIMFIVGFRAQRKFQNRLFFVVSASTAVSVVVTVTVVVTVSVSASATAGTTTAAVAVTVVVTIIVVVKS